LAALSRAGLKKTSPIQELAIIPILDGRDVFAQAETGSGKTAAFAIPIIQQILSQGIIDQIGFGKSLYAVLSPTRELAQQTHSVFQQFGSELGIKSASIIGGESITTQKQLIGQGVHILVATPGRLSDLIRQKEIDLSHCKAIVFDEADRLFDMGFKAEIEFILSQAPNNRQLIMLSATNNQDVLRTAYKFHSTPEEIKVNVDHMLVDKIDHQIAMVNTDEKFSFLVKLLETQQDSYAMVFCNTQFKTHLVAEWLIAMGLKASPISGRLPQNRRTKLLEDFRAKKTTILVCTDVAARGLDIKSVPLVVNYDLPSEASNYVHRIGRTGRAGEVGYAVSLCAHEDCEYLDAINTFINSKIPKLEITDSSFAKNICRKPVIDRETLKVIQSSNQRKTTTSNRQNAQQSQQPQQQRRHPTSNNGNRGPKTSQKRPPQPSQQRQKQFFEIKTSSFKEAEENALKFFKLGDKKMLGHEVITQGPKKFFFFGPRETLYKFFVGINYQEILAPFLAETIRLIGLDLQVVIRHQEQNLRITFSGKDEHLLLSQGSELLEAFDHITRLALYRKVELPSGLRIYVNTSRDKVVTPANNENKPTDLVKLAEEMKKELLEKKVPVFSATLSPADRRIIHLHFENDPQITTHSIGDGHFKKVKVSFGKRDAQRQNYSRRAEFDRKKIHRTGDRA